MKKGHDSVDGLVRAPNKPDLSKLNYGDPAGLTADTLHYLRWRDDKAGFLINVMTNDATRNGCIYETTADEERGEDLETLFREGAKQMRCFGWTGVLHIGSEEEEKELGLDDDFKNLLESIGSSKAVQFFHPYVTDVGGITNWDTDETTGKVTYFYIKPNPTSTEEIKVSAKRMDIWHMPANWWQGYTAISNSFDDIVGLRLWRSTSIRRTRDYATIRYLIQLLNLPSGTVIPQVILDSIEKALGDTVPHSVLPTEAKIDGVAGPVQPEEMGIVTDQAQKGAAVGGGINATDMTGGEAGQKLSVDANQATYAYAIKDIQRDLYPFWKMTFKRLGIKITGFRTPAEIPIEKKFEMLGKLVQYYNMAPPSMKQGVATLIENYFKAEFNIEIQVDVAGDQQFEKDRLQSVMGREGLNNNKTNNQSSSNPEQGKKKWWKRTSKN